MSEAPIELRKLLGRADVLTLAFGAMVGWGWVVLSGEMILKAGTLGSALAFVLGAAMVFPVGLAYAELTSALSRAGGVMSFTFVGMGVAASYVCAWTLALAYVAVCAFEAVALPTVVSYLFPGFNAGYLYTVAGWRVYFSWVVVSVLSALIIGGINYLGIRMASFLQVIATFLLLAIGLAFFIPGSFRGEVGNLTPHFVDLGGFFRVVIMTPFLFVGFDVIPQVAEEIRVPFRAVGKLILFAILLALGWYAMVQITVGLTLENQVFRSMELPTAEAMAKVYGSPWGGRVLVFGGLMGIVTSWNAFFVGASRLLFAMSRGGLLPGVFSRLHPRFESPVAAIALLTALTMLAPFFGRQALIWLVDAGGLATVVAYLIVAVAFLRIRKKLPGLRRPYQVPAPLGVGWLAVAATLFFIMLYMPGSPSALSWPFEWVIILSWVGLGAVLALGLPRRIDAMGRAEMTRRVLGEYAEQIAGLEVDAGRRRAQFDEASSGPGGPRPRGRGEP